MLLEDPLTLLFIITPFGLMTTLVLCLSYVGFSKATTALHWWIAGDVLLAVYRCVSMMQPGLLPPGFEWLEVFPPDVTFVTNIAFLMLAIGAHTLALMHLAQRAGSVRRQALVLLVPFGLFVGGAVPLLYTAYVWPWFLFTVLLAIGMQFFVSFGLKRQYRGALGLVAGQGALLLFHGFTFLTLLADPPPPMPFDAPDLPSVMAMVMDFMVSFLFTLSFALMLQEQLRMDVLQLSITDTLTGALNRRGAAPILTREWKQAGHQRYPLAVAMIDLDNFKAINDAHGHSTGDVALQTFASTVMRLKRKTDVFVRWGGEEFLLVFPHTDIQQAQHFMARLREALRQPQPGSHLPLRLAFSAGLADASAAGSDENFEVLLKALDKALYRAKRQRDRVEVVELVDF
jgi:diguanylate cyclase (GGDEF)-like protein